MPLVALAVLSFAGGCIAGLRGALLLAACVAGIVLAAAWARRSVTAAALALLVAGGTLVGRGSERTSHFCASALLAARSFHATLLADASPGAFVPAVVRGPACETKAYISVSRGSATEGSRVAFTGAPSKGDRGLLIAGAEIRPAGPPALLPRLRRRAGRAIDAAFGADAPLARALLIADTRGLSPAVRERYAAAGLVHMLSISGLHVGIIALAMSLLLRSARVPPAAAALGTAVLTAFYVAVIGAPAPAVRAAAMLGAGSISVAVQRPSSPWAVLAIGAGLPLLSPATAGDVGYQLSVLGMVGLAASASLDRRLLRPRFRGWRRTIAAALLTSTVATIVTMPLVAMHFGRASIIAPISNLAAAPLMAVAQPALFLALLLAPWPDAAQFVAGATHPVLAAFDAVARIAASVPGATLAVALSKVQLLLLSGLCAFATRAALASAPRRHVTCALACGAALVVWPEHVNPARLASARLELHMLDVGQGDALALRTPRGRWVLVDAGRVWRSGDAGRETVVPYVRARGGEVVAFVLSHPHADHVGGAASVIRELRPLEYVDPGFVAGGDAYRASLVAAQEVGTAWRRVRPGDSLVVDGVVVTWLAPDSAWAARLDDANLASTVARVRYGRVTMLLTGDAEVEEEQWLLRNRPELLAADVLKVAHHGSHTSTSPAFLAAVRPRVALVSVGTGNGYGHPDQGLLADLAALRVPVLRSDRLGTVIVSTDGVALSLHSASLAWDLPPP